MKIVFFSNSSWSIYNFRKNLIKKLIQKGHKIFILSSKDSSSIKLKKIGCEFVEVKMNNNKINILEDIFLLFNIKKKLQSIKPDYLLNFTIKPLIFGTFIGNILNIRSICMMTGLGTVFIKKNFLTLIVIFLYKISFSKVYKVIFQNKDDKKKFINLGIVNKKKILVSPGSGVDLNFFKYKKNIFTKKTKFLFFGRLLNEKGVHEYIAVAKKFNKLNFNCEFQIIGSLDKNNPSSISQNDLKNFLKFKNNKFQNFKTDVRSSIQSANCVVLPSYREGTPRGLLEALAIGRPIITTNAIGCKEVIENDRNGFVVKIKDVNSLFDAIKYFHNLNFKKKNQMSNYSRTFVSKKFNEDIVINIYEKLLTKY
tara:strand:+ start:1706 stop:2806 length:1101 start_codon:yes stop_codon:yes gene_type:complete